MRVSDDKMHTKPGPAQLLSLGVRMNTDLPRPIDFAGELHGIFTCAFLTISVE